MEQSNAIAKDISSLFDAIITQGRITGDVKLGEGLNITLKVLDTGGLLAAEAEATTNYPFLPADIVNRGRLVSILSSATVALNGIDIEQSNLSKEDNKERRKTLFKKYMALPVNLVEKAYDRYKELQDEQAEILNKPINEIQDDVTNF